MRTLYIAAPYKMRKQARMVAEALQARGFGITARWIWEEDNDARLAALRDEADIIRAEGLLLLVKPNTGCGMWTELGIAIALKKPIVYFGPKNPRGGNIPVNYSVFLDHPLVSEITSPDVLEAS